MVNVDWSAYYKDRVGSGYTKYAAQRYKPMIKVLTALGGSFKEEGCGIGTISKILLKELPEIKLTMSDFDPAMIKLTKDNTGLEPQKEDIRLGGKDVVNTVFTHGVLEHFTDREIDAILCQQSKIARYSVHYVPTDGYPEPSAGDERLLPYTWWLKKTCPEDYVLFNDNKDLLLILDNR